MKPKDIELRPIPYQAARVLLVRHHYIHSIAASTRLCLGAFVGSHLLGVVQFNCGNMGAHRLVEGAKPQDCVTLARLWLSDQLPSNSESRVIGISLRLLRKYSPAKFVLTYADPSQGHLGRIYQATNWLYLGRSESRKLIDIGDGKLRHTRTLSHRLGSSALAYVQSLAPEARAVSGEAKHKYIYFLDQSWRGRLKLPVMPYPRECNGDSAYSN
jgi:hypothetical protein